MNIGLISRKPRGPALKRFFLVCFIGGSVGCGLTASRGETRYVLKDNPGAEPPFTSWETAAPDIQTALDAATAGDIVLVADGIYDNGAHLSIDGATNRVVVADGLIVQSQNGPAGATILGGTGIRAVALSGTARLIGFRLTSATGISAVWGEDGSARVENCRIDGNTSALRGGGAAGVTLIGCQVMSNTALLRGGGAYDCTLQDCLLLANTAENGGGASASVLWNCRVISNQAAEAGGGAHESVLRGCLAVGNTARVGGGAANSDLFNSTLAGNRAAAEGGGLAGGEVFNSIVIGNWREPNTPDNWSQALFHYSCTTPLPAGNGNIHDNPRFIAPEIGNYRLLADSPCINAGTNQDWMAAATDLDGQPRILDDIVDMGAFEFENLPPPNPQLVILAAHGTPLQNNAAPSPETGTMWEGRTGTTSSRTFWLTNSGNAVVTIHSLAWSGPGSGGFSHSDFPLFLAPAESQPLQILFTPPTDGVYVATLAISHSASNVATPFLMNFRCGGVPPRNRYVAAGNPLAMAPYTNWAMAAANIQAAISVALPGDTIWVSNGIYASGAISGLGDVLHRVAVTNSVALRSVNGPAVTIIQGSQGVRGVFLGSQSSLDGFTVRHGSNAGGIYCADETAVVSNCLVMDNSASVGGGILGGTIHSSLLVGNSADNGGGAFNAVLYDCMLMNNVAELGGGACDSELFGCRLEENIATEAGGGAYASVLRRCWLQQNEAQGNLGGGGGAAASTLFSCVLTQNRAAYGGGSRGGELYNCTLVGNEAGMEAGGAYEGTLHNCIVYFNTQGFVEDNVSAATLSYSCTRPLVPGAGNLDADPLFADIHADNYRLQTNSPCRDAGQNHAWMAGEFDLEGNPRRVGASADMGAYEYPFTFSGIAAAWLLQYNLALDGSEDFLDSDGDQMNNWQEWRAQTDPRNRLSLLAMTLPAQKTPPDGIGWRIQWQSVPGKIYYLERSRHLPSNPAFEPIAGPLVAESGFTTYTDRTATANSPYIYRVKIP